MLAQLIVGMIATVQQPLYEYQTDEEGHLNTARFVAEQHRLPGQEDLQWNPQTLQYSQPPLFYFVTAPLLWLVDDGSPIPGQPTPLSVCQSYNPNLTTWARPINFNVFDSGAVRTGYLLRLTQLAIALVITVIIHATVLLFSPRAYVQALSAAALFAFMPSLVSTVAFIGNDVLVMFWGALGLYIFTKRRNRTSLSQNSLTFSVLILIAALATLTKTTGWAVFVFPALVPLQILTRSKHGRRLGVVFFGLLLLTAVGVALFNYQAYGSVIGRYPVEALQANQNLWDILRPMAVEFWGSISLMTTLSANAVPGLGRLQTASLTVLVVGLVLLSLWFIRSRDVKETVIPPLCLVGASATLLLIRNLSTINELYVFAPFRYLGPAIPALMILAAAGLASLPRGLRAVSLFFVPASWVLLSLLINTMSPEAVVQRNAAVAGNQLPDNVTIVDANQAESAIKVAGYWLAPNDSFDDGTIKLVLYLTAEDRTPEDSLALELTAGITSCRVVPVRGFRPGTSFAPGELVAAEVELPYCGDAGHGPVDINLEWLAVSDDNKSSVAVENSTLSLFTLPDGPVSRAPQCLADLGSFNDQFQIIKADIPEFFDAPGQLLSSVNWWAKASTGVAYTRVYVLRDEQGHEVARCEGAPRQNSYPMDRWQEGEIIYDDRCEMQVPELPSGETYRVWVGLRNPDDGNFLPHDGTEDPLFQFVGVTTAQSP